MIYYLLASATTILPNLLRQASLKLRKARYWLTRGSKYVRLLPFACGGKNITALGYVQSYVHTIPDSVFAGLKPYRIGFLFTYKNSGLGAISVAGAKLRRVDL